MNSLIEFKHLRTITAISENGSLVDAAERLFLTQSALSHQIKDLEGRLGVELFIRKARPLRLTVAGERLLETANAVLPIIRNSERDIKRLAGGETGRLHIAIECHSCFDWLMPAINQYRLHWQEVELDLSTAFNFVPLPALKTGKLDMVITSAPEEISGIHYEPLFRFEIQLVVNNHHRLADKPYVTPGQLKKETLITYPVDRDRVDVFTQFLDPAGVEPADVRTAELTLMMVQLVASGRGVCALPNWALTQYLDSGYVSALALGKTGLHSSLYVAIRENQQDSIYIQEFLKIARETCFENLKGITPF